MNIMWSLPIYFLLLFSNTQLFYFLLCLFFFLVIHPLLYLIQCDIRLFSVTMSRCWSVYFSFLFKLHFFSSSKNCFNILQWKADILKCTKRRHCWTQNFVICPTDYLQGFEKQWRQHSKKKEIPWCLSI